MTESPNPPSRPSGDSPSPEVPKGDLIGRLVRAIAERLRSVADTLDARADRRAAKKITPEEPDLGRRSAVTKILLTPVVSAASAFLLRKGIKEKYEDKKEAAALSTLLGVPETREWEPSELTDNWVRSFERMHGMLHKNEIVFVDQQGNIIDEPIPVRDHQFEGEAVATPCRDGDQMNQEWLNKWRTTLKKRYPTIHEDLTLNEEHPVLYNVINALEDKDEDETVLDIAWKNATTDMVADTGKTKLAFIEETFAESTLPKDLKEIIMYGIPSIESMFNDNAESTKNARGCWQFLEGTASDFGLVQTRTDLVDEEYKHYPFKNVPANRLPLKYRKKGIRKWQDIYQMRTRRVRKTVHDDYRGDFVRSTEAALKYFEQIYRELRTNPNYRTIMERFNPAEADLLYPCVITAYHSGQGKMKAVMKWFVENYPVETVEAAMGNGPYGIDLFTCMNLRYEKEAHDEYYKKKSKDYYPKAVSMRNLMMARKQNPNYHPVLSAEESYEPPPYPDSMYEIAKQHPHLISAGTIVVGTAAGLVAGRKAISRRRLLGAAGVTTGVSLAGAAVGTYGGASEFRETPEQKQEREIIEEIADFEWGDISQSDEVGKDLMRMESLIDKRASNRQADINSGIHYSEIDPWISAQGTSKLPKFENISAVRSAAETGRLKPLKSYTSTAYRCRGVGINSGDFRRNNPDNLNVYPHLEKTIIEIDDRLNIELGQIGFPTDKYQMRVVITSAMRPASLNREVGGVKTSAHLYGVAFDISRSRFDIIDKQKGKFYDVSSREDSVGVNQKHRVSAHAYAALTRVVKAMEDEGKIFVNRESDHLHIVDKKFDAI